jgi:hypothetical protein
MRTVKAWAVVNAKGECCYLALFGKVFAQDEAEWCSKSSGMKHESVPVRIVPEAEYKRMMAAVKVADAYSHGRWNELHDLEDAYGKAVKRGK